MKTTQLIAILLFSFLTQSEAQKISPSAKRSIEKQIVNLRTAHLESDTALADKVYHDALILVSQSGKKYGKKDALANIKNKFVSYENSDMTFLKISKKVVLTNYINERKFAQFPKGRYRLTVIWKKEKGEWKIISMQSSKVKG